jgi:hypothetical protein
MDASMEETTDVVGRIRGLGERGINADPHTIPPGEPAASGGSRLLPELPARLVVQKEEPPPSWCFSPLNLKGLTHGRPPFRLIDRDAPILP